jgi:hypothetical protein
MERRLADRAEAGYEQMRRRSLDERLPGRYH